ncbi:MAG: ABC transporter ATP-binding protein [Pirellulales bacterium]|nr:ABC transporter ATP-binding protein [Pirellulales bacterium]
MKPVIRLENVTKRFGAQTALSDVSLEVGPGVVYALLGENGAGKTTAIRIMLGLAEPNSGQAEVLGLRSDRDGLAIRRRIGYVPEQPTLYDWMRVGEIGWFAAGFYGDGFLPRYYELAARFGLPERRKLKTLSKGMRAKVALSLALANDPELLVLDEPTSGLDALVRREFLESMVDRAAAGKTVLLSSHQIAEVERVADVVAVMRQGRLVLVERLDELKRQTRELTITLADGADAPPDLNGDVLYRCRKGHQWQWLVRHMAEAQLADLRAHPSVRGLEVRTPSLEEIFVAYMQAGRQTDDPAEQTQLSEEAPAP